MEEMNDTRAVCERCEQEEILEVWVSAWRSEQEEILEVCMCTSEHEQEVRVSPGSDRENVHDQSK